MTGNARPKTGMPRHEVLFEGFRQDEILNLPKETVEQLILLGEPLVFWVGSAVLLGSSKSILIGWWLNLPRSKAVGMECWFLSLPYRGGTPSCTI